MKTLTLLTLFLLGSITSHAQFNDDKALYISKVEKYGRMKKTGKFLTFTGTAVAVIGLVTLFNSSTETTYNGSGQQTRTTGNPEAGAAGWIIGNAMVSAGIPLWIVGGVNEGKYQRKLNALSVRMQRQPNGMGVALCYRF